MDGIASNRFRSAAESETFRLDALDLTDNRHGEAMPKF